jgi:hypothetical protein
MPTKSQRQLVIGKHIIGDLYAFGDSVCNIITDGITDKKSSIHFVGNSISD